MSSGTGKRSRSVYIYFRPVGTRWTDLVATMQLQSMSPILFYCQAHFSQLGCLCTAGWPFPSCKVFTIFIKIVVFFLFLYICALAGHVNILSDKRHCYRRYDLVKWTWYVQIQITTILKYKVTFYIKKISVHTTRVLLKVLSHVNWEYTTIRFLYN